MLSKHFRLLLVMAAVAALPSGVQAQVTFALPEKGDLEALAITIPDQDWYPAGYRELKIAAASEYGNEIDVLSRRFSQEKGLPGTFYLFYFSYETGYDWESVRRRFDVPTNGKKLTPTKFIVAYSRLEIGTCTFFDAGEVGEIDNYQYLSYVARLVAKTSYDLDKAGYPEDLVAEYLLDFEKYLIARSDYGTPYSEIDFAAIDPKFRFGSRFRKAMESRLASVEDSEAAEGSLVAILNAERIARQLDVPELMEVEGCGGAEDTVILQTRPAGGQVWVISAFAFRVCSLRRPDPWDKFACRWSEVEVGAEAGLSGRYVYEVRWADGTVNRGIRELIGPGPDGDSPTFTFQKSAAVPKRR